MEISSKEHKQLLFKSIVKIAVKTLTLGVIIGLMLMVPNIIRDNLFSRSLAYTGQAIILVSLVYSLGIAFKKYRNTLGKLD